MVIIPPTTGPPAAATPYTNPIAPTYKGSLSVGSEAAKRATAPLMRPAPPQPVTARPRMKAVEVGLTAQRTDPDSNMASDARNTNLTLKVLYKRPKMSWKAHRVIRYAEPYHCTKLLATEKLEVDLKTYTDVGQRPELVCNLRNSRGDDSFI